MKPVNKEQIDERFLKTHHEMWTTVGSGHTNPHIVFNIVLLMCYLMLP